MSKSKICGTQGWLAVVTRSFGTTVMRPPAADRCNPFPKSMKNPRGCQEAGGRRIGDLNAWNVCFEARPYARRMVGMSFGISQVVCLVGSQKWVTGTRAGVWPQAGPHGRPSHCQQVDILKLLLTQAKSRQSCPPPKYMGDCIVETHFRHGFHEAGMSPNTSKSAVMSYLQSRARVMIDGAPWSHECVSPPRRIGVERH